MKPVHNCHLIQFTVHNRTVFFNMDSIVVGRGIQKGQKQDKQ